ncbi:MAG: MerR family transcriptional regulator, partial [Flavobacteriales bacterium]|nr:MerR family transcriptional regulator [Flavobacteriales bacterium]
MPLNKPIEKRYFSITEVAKRLKVNASQLRYCEKEFHQLKPRTNARGKRFYTESDVQIIEQVRWLVKNQGFTIEGARKAMRKRGEVRQMMESDSV